MFQVELLHYHRFNIGGVDKTDILCQLCPLATICEFSMTFNDCPITFEVLLMVFDVFSAF